MIPDANSLRLKTGQLASPFAQTMATERESYDYEEGTWTPEYHTSDYLQTCTYDLARLGCYIKVGRLRFDSRQQQLTLVSGGSIQNCDCKTTFI